MALISNDDNTAGKPKTTDSKTVDPDTLPAPVQLEVAQLNAQRTDAEGRGDEEDLKRIDGALAALTGGKGKTEPTK